MPITSDADLSSAFISYGAPLSKVFHDNTLFGDGTRTSPLRILGANLAAAGSNTQIQFNNSGVFGGSSNLTWNGTTLAVNQRVQANSFRFSTSGPELLYGSGTPESAVTAVVGSLYLRTNGGAATTLYVKESGSGNTGWVAK